MNRIESHEAHENADPIAADEAMEWLGRLRAADVTESEQADFAAWLAASSANSNAFDEACALWHLLGSLPANVVALPRRAPRYKVVRPFAAAASLLVACLVFILQVATPQYMTAKGEQRRVALADGTTAYLNTDSRMTVDYQDGVRRIVLHHGEAWFDVHHEPERPFIVEGRFATAQALGTAFVVREHQGFSKVAVTEGTVAVTPSAGATPAYLRAGEMKTLSSNTIDRGVFDVEAALAWQHGQLIYNDIRLDDLLADLNRYLPKTMTINDDALLGARVNLVLNLEHQDAMLEALGRALPVRWKSVSEDLIILTSR